MPIHSPEFPSPWPLGAMGVIYPPSLLIAGLKRAGTAFQGRCPKGDDSGFMFKHFAQAYKVSRSSQICLIFRFKRCRELQHNALSYRKRNLTEIGNDRQVRATYTQADVQRFEPH